MTTLLRFRMSRAGLRSLLIGALTLTPAAAQYPVNLQVAPDGRRLDANPQIGGTRFYDYSRPQSPLMAGNLLTTGNVRGGLSFQGYSPIADPRSFRAGLPSGSLSSFVRDSVSVADSQTPLGGLARQPFFDPVYTAPTAGSLQGQFAPQALRPSVPNLAGTYSGIDARQSTGPLGAEITGAWSGLQVGSPLDRLDLSERQGTLASRLFGVEQFRLPGERPGARAGRPEARDLGDRLEGLGPERPDPRAILKDELEHMDRPAEPALSSRLRVTPLPLGSRLDEVLGSASAAVPAASRSDRFWRTAAAPGTPEAPQTPVDPRTRPGAGPDSPVTAAGITTPKALLVPGQDAFTDMQLAVALERDPGAAWFAQMQQAIQQDPTLSARARDAAAGQASDFVQRVLQNALQSFAGESTTAVNTELRRAESFMNLGRYYDAADHYRRAHLLDPLNPLPLVGRGHALLAAGDYLSAAVMLTQGLERFPEMARFSLDLKAMMGGGEIVDIRRADIMRQLQQNEDPRLRFLLGYLEFHGGMPERGIENLRKAAGEADPGTLLRRYPDMLEGKGALPPPKLPPGVLKEEAGPAEDGGQP